MRIRKIRKWGNSAVIPLISADMKDLDLKLGDEVDIDDIVKIKKTLQNGSKSQKKGIPQERGDKK